MAKSKVAVTLEAALLRRVDRMVREGRFANRSQAIEAAIAGQLERLSRSRLAEECARLDPVEEQALADEGLAAEAARWPAY